MVRAILDGRKTVTRRVGKTWSKVRPGDRLWVRECWARGADAFPGIHSTMRALDFVYRSEMEECHELQGWRWRPSIFMPRSACRIELTVRSVTEQYGMPGTVLVEHPIDATADRIDCAITADEARREGFDSPRDFLGAWVSMHPGYVGPVWRIEFSR